MLEKLLKVESIKKYPEDTDLLEDVITENKQAIEMAHVYTGILNSTMDTFSSVISNNVNGGDEVSGHGHHRHGDSLPWCASAYGMNVNTQRDARFAVSR